MKVKICGLTNREDAVWALNDGAQFIGVDFRKRSPRRVAPDDAKEWVPALPTFAGVVGLFEDEEPDSVAQLAAEMNLRGVQLNGTQTPERLKRVRQALTITEVRPFVIKAMSFPGPETLEDIPKWSAVIDYVLLDGPGPFDWALAADAAKYGKPVFLGGGLTVENIPVAVAQGRPFALDVTSGIEKSTRRKNQAKMRSFITMALLGRPG